MAVLIVTSDDDISADAVAAEITRQSPRTQVWRIDPGRFPTEVSLAAYFDQEGRLTGYLTPRGGDHHVHLGRIDSAWYRRPTAFTFPDTVEDPHWAAREARMGLGGVLACLPFLNHPADIAAAEYKPLQLREAGRVGFRIPRTVVTNVLSAARGLSRGDWRTSHVVRKNMSALCKPGTTLEVQVHEHKHLTNADWPAIGHTAHMFQALVDKRYDVRLTMVDRVAHAARIDSPTLDWRASYDHLDYSITEPPAAVLERCRRLMERYRLRFAAFDFGVTADNTWYFFELNPNGQWLWLDRELDLGIGRAIARALLDGA